MANPCFMTCCCARCCCRGAAMAVRWRARARRALPDVSWRGAESVIVLCGEYLSTLRRVRFYTPQGICLFSCLFGVVGQQRHAGKKKVEECLGGAPAGRGAAKKRTALSEKLKYYEAKARQPFEKNWQDRLFPVKKLSGAPKATGQECFLAAPRDSSLWQCGRHFTRFTPSCVGTTGLMVPSSLNSILSMHTSRCTPGWCLM